MNNRTLLSIGCLLCLFSLPVSLEAKAPSLFTDSKAMSGPRRTSASTLRPTLRLIHTFAQSQNKEHALLRGEQEISPELKSRGAAVFGENLNPFRTTTIKKTQEGVVRSRGRVGASDVNPTSRELRNAAWTRHDGKRSRE